MELAQITAGQVVMLFLLMGTGIAAVKTGVLKPEGKQTLSNLLVYLVVPAMIVNSYRMEFSMEILHNLLASFGMSLLALLIGTGITLALTARRKDSRTPSTGSPAFFPMRRTWVFRSSRRCSGPRVCSMPAPM